MKVASLSSTVALLLGALSPLALGQEARTYTDDLGVVHSTTIDKPTIVTYALTAVSLFDYGLGTDQLLGTYGQYFVSGSDFDFSKPAEASSFSADPEPEDLVKLQSVVNLSPTCAENFGYCLQFNISTLLDLNPDYLVVHGFAENPWSFSNFSEVLAVWPQDKIIFNDVSLQGDDCYQTDACYGKSMIDVVEQYIELSEFLNYELPLEFEQDLVDLCGAARTFQANMQVAHSNGIRTLAGALDPTNSFFANPIDDIVLRMFEELGMPILHLGSCTNAEACSINYYWESVATTEYFMDCTDAQKAAFDYSSCNENTLFPVDVWLYDHRSRDFALSDDFAAAFPDLAILKAQLAEWPIGANKITPAHAVEILNSVGPIIASATRLHEATDCVVANVTSIEHRQSGDGIKGVGAGQYACYEETFHNSKYFQWCETVTPAPVASTPVASPTVTSSPVATPITPTTAPVVAPSPTTEQSSALSGDWKFPTLLTFLASFTFLWML